jgi:hypothetical protein
MGKGADGWVVGKNGMWDDIPVMVGVWEWYQKVCCYFLILRVGG